MQAAAPLLFATLKLVYSCLQGLAPLNESILDGLQPLQNVTQAFAPTIDGSAADLGNVCLSEKQKVHPVLHIKYFSG